MAYGYGYGLSVDILYIHELKNYIMRPAVGEKEGLRRENKKGAKGGWEGIHKTLNCFVGLLQLKNFNNLKG